VNAAGQEGRCVWGVDLEWTDVGDSDRDEFRSPRFVAFQAVALYQPLDGIASRALGLDLRFVSYDGREKRKWRCMTHQKTVGSSDPISSCFRLSSCSPLFAESRQLAL
jgi:hypothetical protein